MEHQNHHSNGGAGLLNTSGARFRHRRSPPSTERFLGIFQPPKSSSSSPSPPVELSEDDIFSVTSPSSSPPQPKTPLSFPNHSPSPSSSSSSPNHNGILAALVDNNAGFRSKSKSNPSPQPVFNRKVSSSSLASSPSTSPLSTRVLIPRRHLPPVAHDRGFLRHQSAPINVPPAMRPRPRDMDEVLLEEEEEEEEENAGGMILPPHELIDARNSPMLACSVLEGAGRTLKGRDLRQVRNAIWRKTGFID